MMRRPLEPLMPPLSEREYLATRSRPRLSFIIGARNDGYMGNFTWRFETTLNYLADNLQTLGRLDDVEVVVTDWGSQVPLHTTLSVNCAAKRIVRYLLVPSELAVRLQGDSEFPIVLAQNAAIRRSRGEYVTQTDSDILFTPEFLLTLFEILDGRRIIGSPVDHTLIVAKRRQVPWEYISQSPEIAKLDFIIRRFGCFLPVDSVKEFGFAATGMMMMHRHLWEECRGYDERLIHWGWMEIDLGLRITRAFPWFDLTREGSTVFHLEHYHPAGRRTPTRKYNPMIRDNSYCPNNEHWGLGAYALEVFTYPDDGPQKELTGVGQLPPVRPDPRLLTALVQITLVSVWRWLKQAAADRLGILRHLRSCFSSAKGRVIVVRRTLDSQPVLRWPALLRDLWMERRHGRQRPARDTE